MAGAETNTTSQGLLDAQLIANRIAVADSFTSNWYRARMRCRSIVAASPQAIGRAMLAEVVATTSAADFDTTVNATVTALTPNHRDRVTLLHLTPMSASAATLDLPHRTTACVPV